MAAVLTRPPRYCEDESPAAVGMPPTAALRGVGLTSRSEIGIPRDEGDKRSREAVKQHRSNIWLLG